MRETFPWKMTEPLWIGVAAVSLAVATLGESHVLAQQPQAAGAARATTAQSRAPIDLTGYWVPVVTEDWRYRMITPPKGDFTSVPLNAEGRRVADTWDLAKDTAEGNLCRAFGAPAVMRLPLRLHITWQDASTLKVETDAGQQVRLFRFGENQKVPAGEQGYQGYSVAMWQIDGPAGAAAPAGGRG